MTQYNNSAEGGTSGTTVTTANSGGSSGAAWDAVAIDPTDDFAFSNTHAAHGSLSYHVVIGNTPGVATVEKDFPAATTTVAVRFYLYMTGTPNHNITVLYLLNGSTVRSWISIDNARHLFLRDAGGSAVIVQTGVIPLNQWVRVEAQWPVLSSTVGQATLSRYDSMDSATPTETATSAASQDFGGSADRVRWGSVQAPLSGDTWDFWLDDIGENDTAVALGPSITSLAGTSHGVATATGTVKVTRGLSGASHGVGHATGTVDVPSLHLSAAGSRHRAGAVFLAISPLIAPPAGTPGQGWEANGRVRDGSVVLDFDPADPPDPPNLHRVHLKTLTNTYDPPTIVEGQPYNADGSPWSPLDGEGTHGDWGFYRVIIDGQNRTLVRGFPTLVISYSDEDPGGPVTMTIAFPGITSYDELDHGDLKGIRPDAKIRVEHRNPDGTWADDAFDGEMGIESDTLTDASGGTAPASYLTFTCRGWWEVLDDFITLPRANPDPIEAARFIEGHAHRAREFGWPAHMPASGITGLEIAERGEYGAPMQSQTIVNALKLMQRLDGTVYTVAWTGRSRLEIVERSWGGAPDFSLYVGQRGVSHTLTRDPEQAKTAIYGRGQTGNQAWENWQYPSAYVNPPPYPLPSGGVCGVNLFCAGYGATGFQVFSDEVRSHYDVDLASQDTYLAEDSDVIFDFQGKLGVQQDGVVGPQTWNQTFQLGQNADVLADAYIRELWAVPDTQPWILNARGGIVGRNPGFDPNQWRRRETLVDYSVLKKSTARTSARIEGQRTRLPYYVGTIVARNIDPLQMPALDTRSGMNMQFLGHRGVDRDLHVVKRDVTTGMNVGGGASDRVVTWTVSEQPDDMMTLAQIIARKHGVRDLVRNNRPHRRSAHRTPDWVPFDSESGAGIQAPVAQFAGLWNVLWVPMGEAVDVQAVKLVANTPCLIAAAMFNQKITPDYLTSLPGLANPSAGTDDPWQANADALDAIGIQWATGGPSAMQGYWPHAPGGTITGVLADTSPWPFRTLRPPWGYLAVWTSASCRISGDPARGYRAIFPAPEN